MVKLIMDKLGYVVKVINSCENLEQVHVAFNWGVMISPDCIVHISTLLDVAADKHLNLSQGKKGELIHLKDFRNESE